MSRCELTLEQLTVLSAVNRRMSISEVADRATDLLSSPRFDRAVALAITHDLVKLRYLEQDWITVRVTCKGAAAAVQAFDAISTLKKQW